MVPGSKAKQKLEIFYRNASSRAGDGDLTNLQTFKNK